MKLTLCKNVLLLVALCAIFLPAYAKMQQLRQKDAVLSQKLERLTLENKKLSEEIELLKTDAVYIEEVAREKLKVARENEIVFRVINSEEE
ncbi:MAG: septum formation initiator family protein [Candidatus Omnitrophica bacterium]|nr:septum formation initiator family protein [Patescibacteria group bacterium]MBU4304320.1 septum formation initiator family protein [Candidatus Omnitrophota bacterium]MBU4479055.1 septum formation initiator family protein [Candidatus Omnitrophota bacterium]MCG2702762.1 septum formation initiator family protein [Candidatus Omnitrophota bacterium]